MSSHTSVVISARTPSALARAMRTAETIEVAFSGSKAQKPNASGAAFPFCGSVGSITKPAHCMTERHSFSERPSRCE